MNDLNQKVKNYRELKPFLTPPPPHLIGIVLVQLQILLI